MSPQTSKKLSHGKKIVFSLTLLAITTVLILVVGEIVLRVFSPVEYLYPRYQYSSDYGFTLFENRRMEHSIPGKYQYFYDINKFGYRGEPIAVAQKYDRTHIVVLGDSYSFGMGVADGDEYAQRLGTHLGATYDVINLSTPGWGLTQQIRRYYDFGRLYRPKYVVLQFCSNDPEDNFNNMVTQVEGDNFVYGGAGSGINWSKKYLSDSIIQKSQLYNFFRGRAYVVVKNLLVRRKEEKYASQPREAAGSVNNDIGRSAKEAFYNDLLGVFARRLADDNVQLVVIAVNNQLDTFPGIRDNVFALDAAGSLHYVEVVEWFDGVTDFQSPEGHMWGAKGHAIIAEGLAKVIRRLDIEGDSR